MTAQTWQERAQRRPGEPVALWMWRAFNEMADDVAAGAQAAHKAVKAEGRQHELPACREAESHG